MNNRQAEKLLLSGFVRHPDSFFAYSQYLTIDDFTHPASQSIFEVLHSLFIEKEAEKISKARILAEARALNISNFLKVTDDGRVIDEILSERVESQDIKDHFLEVKRQTLFRSYSSAADDVKHYLRETKDPLHDVISSVESKIISAVGTVDYGETGVKRLPEGLRNFIDKLADTPGALGIDIGLPSYQSRIGGLRKPSVTFIVATAKAGKTQLGLRSALHVAHKLSLPVLYIDTELSENDQKVRLVGQLAEVPYDIIETGYWKLSEAELRSNNLTDQEVNRILDYKRRLQDDQFWEVIEKLPIDYLSVAGKPLEEVLPHMRRWYLTKVRPDPDSKFPQCLIIYDYLKLATVDELRGGKVQEWQLHGLNYAALHDFAKKFELPILCFGQTNRGNVDDESCIAGAKRILENVTSAAIFRKKRDDEYGWDSKGSHLIKVFATRHGKGTTGPGYINLDADLSIGKFTDLGLGTVNFDEQRQLALEQQKARKKKKKYDDDDDD